ncbi:MAG: TolC family protein, partial [Parachlamydiaceae bacterium]|nr:TolC family protein [Parachlamydiaceae bacterium]
MKKNFFSFICFNYLLSSCCVGPTYEAPDYQVPCEWKSKTSPKLNTISPDNVIWWEALQDPLLNELISEAASQNLDLQIVAIRVLQSREIAKLKKWDYYPHVDASLSYNHV